MSCLCSAHYIHVPQQWLKLKANAKKYIDLLNTLTLLLNNIMLQQSKDNKTQHDKVSL